VKFAEVGKVSSDVSSDVRVRRSSVEIMHAEDSIVAAVHGTRGRTRVKVIINDSEVMGYALVGIPCTNDIFECVSFLYLIHTYYPIIGKGGKRPVQFHIHVER